MSSTAHFHIHGLHLIVHPKSYTVEVKSEEPAGKEDLVEDLPNWIFDSRQAIWFSDKAATYFESAMFGDRIKEKLLREVRRK